MVRLAAAGAVTLLLMTSCAPAGPAVPPASATPGPAAAKATEPCASGGLAVSPLQTAPPTPAPTATTPAPTTAPPDRKSVVEGKRVDLGGRRIIKKKKSET